MDVREIATRGTPPPVDESTVAMFVEAAVEPNGVAANLIAQTKREPWTVTSIRAADWAMDRVAEAERIAQEYEAEAQHWQRQATRARAVADYLRDRLKEWALRRRHETGAMSVELHAGKITTRKTNRKLVVVDDDAALAWCRINCGDAIKLTEKVLVSKLTGIEPVEYVVAIERLDTETGEFVVVNLDEHERVDAWAPPDDDPAWVPITQWFALDDQGRFVPGVSVEPESVTATVTPDPSALNPGSRS